MPTKRRTHPSLCHSSNPRNRRNRPGSRSTAVIERPLNHPWRCYGDIAIIRRGYPHGGSGRRTDGGRQWKRHRRVVRGRRWTEDMAHSTLVSSRRELVEISRRPRRSAMAERTRTHGRRARKHERTNTRVTCPDTCARRGGGGGRRHG